MAAADREDIWTLTKLRSISLTEARFSRDSRSGRTRRLGTVATMEVCWWAELAVRPDCLDDFEKLVFPFAGYSADKNPLRFSLPSPRRRQRRDTGVLS